MNNNGTRPKKGLSISFVYIHIHTGFDSLLHVFSSNDTTLLCFSSAYCIPKMSFEEQRFHLTFLVSVNVKSDANVFSRNESEQF